MSVSQATSQESQEPPYESTELQVGAWFFKYRDYTPIPLIILLFIFAAPSAATATIGTLMVLFGELIRIYAVSFIGSISRTRKDRTGGALVDQGPFGLVRNPLYVGNFFITMGVATYAGHLSLWILTAVLFAVQYYFIVAYEESFLKQSFGEEYADYCQRVPRWFPMGLSLEKLSHLPLPSELYKALRSERQTLMAIVAMLFILSLLG